MLIIAPLLLTSSLLHSGFLKNKYQVIVLCSQYDEMVLHIQNI